MRKTSAQVGGKALHNLVITTLSCPQVVFATAPRSITRPFVPNLYELGAQLYAPLTFTRNGLHNRLIPTIHSPNNDYNKGE